MHKYTGLYDNPFDEHLNPYEHLLWNIYTDGIEREDRTGVGTLSKFGCRMEFPLFKNFFSDEFSCIDFPLITTKKMYLKGIIYELLWMLRGDTNVKWLQEHDVHIWDEWADENGDLGPVYGKQWRDWNGVDQISEALRLIKEEPTSRRIIVNAWNVGELKDMALPPCHMMMQFYVNTKLNELDCQLYQRSADMFLGVPFNIAEYSLLTMMMAQQAGLKPGKFIWIGGDCHIYKNHLEQVYEQLHRLPYPEPVMTIDKADSIFDYKYDDFHLKAYKHYPTIKAPVAV